MTTTLLGEIKKRQMKFIWHMLTKKEMEYLLLTGKIDVKKSRRRPRQMYLQSIAQRFRDFMHRTDPCCH